MAGEVLKLHVYLPPTSSDPTGGKTDSPVHGSSPSLEERRKIDMGLPGKEKRQLP